MSMFGPPAPEPGIFTKVVFGAIGVGIALWVTYGLISMVVWLIEHLRISII